ncbi:MAG: hypothetical protein J1F65_03475 [Clostridiales bacterium]|nr:hypothetical protein [Clostridiales bacterium]
MVEKDKEVLQIEEKYKDEFDSLYDRIHVQVEENIVKQAQLRKKRKQLSIRLSSIAVALVLVISLSVVLPIVLQPSDDTILRYNDMNIQSEVVDYTLKDYIQSLGDHVLYLDWYETADDCITTRYYDVENTKTTVFMQEKIFNEGYTVEISVLKKDDKIIVETLETDWGEPKSIKINDVEVLYKSYIDKCNTKFVYEGYTYYLYFLDTADMDFITATIESMFNTVE